MCMEVFAWEALNANPKFISNCTAQCKNFRMAGFDPKT